MTRLTFAIALALAAAAVLAGPAAPKTDSGQAVGISSITPAVADRGGTVTITGNGFGARNLRVTVGGIAAELLSATGSRASFRVPALAGPGLVLVRATNPGGRVGEIGLMVRFDGVSTPVLDTPRRVSGTIGRAGGTLASSGLTLTIPSGALSENTPIALTPLLDLADSPLAGSIIGGAKLEPEGLRFLRPATLSFAVPTNVPTADVIGFGSAGDGSELHLQPHSLVGGTISLQLWHFSTAGGSSGGSGAATAMQRPISNAERQAKQRIAAAHRACNAEVAQGIFAGPACANVTPESVRALFDWYTNAVRPGLQAAPNAPSFDAEAALSEWLAWEAEVRELFRNSAPPACGTLQNECEAAHALATTAVGAHAQRRLDNCTGTSLAAQLRDVARMADFAGAGAIDITTLGLPDATSGALLRACAHLEITVTDFPAVAALFHANTLRGRVTLDVNTGPDRNPVPLTLTVDGSVVETASDGAFETTLTPGEAGLPLDVELEAEANDPDFQSTSFTAIRDLSRPTRARLKLIAQSPTSIAAGGTVAFLVQVAGDGMSGGTVTLSVGGPGSISPSPVTTNAGGEATSVYTAPALTAVPDANVTAALPDGTSATIPITITPLVTVGLSPASATVSTGGTQNFSASVTGSFLGVTWTATGGAIVTTGSTTARYEAGSTAGTFSVTATSIADPTKSATATVQITGASGSVTLNQALSEIRVSAEACAGRDGEGCVIHFDSNRDFLAGLGTFVGELNGSVTRVGTPGFYEGNSASSTASATLSSDVDTTGGLLEVVASGSTSGTAQRTFGANPSAHAAYSSQASVFIRFRVVGGSLRFTVTGSGQATGTVGSGNVTFVLYRLSPFEFIKRVEAGSFDTSGTLAPGTYEMGLGGSCAADQPATCDTSFSLSFRLQG